MPGRLPSRARYILMQKDDVKFREWARHSPPGGVAMAAAAGSPILLPFRLIVSSLRRGRPAAVVLRYLNDYRSFWRTAARVVSDVFVLSMCRLLHVQVVWMCHNVDRETSLNFPRISEYRRRAVCYFANKVLVLDPLLLPHAAEHLPVAAGQLAYTCFGEPPSVHDSTDESELVRDIAHFVQAARQSTARAVLVGLCVGSPSPKMGHFELARPFLDRCAAIGIEARLIICGPISEYLRSAAPDVLQSLEADDRIFFRGDRYVALDHGSISDFVDFFWKVYYDLSVPFSAYSAASAERPILTVRHGFLSELVEQYRLGAVLDANMSNCEQAVADIVSWDPEASREFLRQHTWARGAGLITSACLETEVDRTEW